MLAAPLDRWQALAETNTARAADLAAACADELQRAAAHYEKTELANLKLADAHYPAATSPKLTPGEVIAHASTGDFGDWESASADPRDPNSKYSGPPAPTELDATEGWPTDLEEKVERLTGATSVATHVRALLRQIVGLDPFDLITTLVSGDWKLLMTQGMIFEDTAIAFTRIKENITRGCYAIQDTWEGNAASAAENWLMAYAKAAGAHAQFSRDAGWKIKNFARAAYHGFVALNIGVDALLDSVVDLLFLGPLKETPQRRRRGGSRVRSGSRHRRRPALPGPPGPSRRRSGGGQRRSRRLHLARPALRPPGPLPMTEIQAPGKPNPAAPPEPPKCASWPPEPAN
ncbi:hypothetical protein ACFQV2_25095 [Actinokineospora soli]|uniref:PPE family protein n=1 Tax=Actinokineospora soli TaxID=1048753 RepID=A0ABW2TTM4_9PSEU